MLRWLSVERGMRFDGVCGGEEGRRRLSNYEEFNHRGRLPNQWMNHVASCPLMSTGQWERSTF